MLDKNDHDVTKVFLIYMTLIGDVEKTALALDMHPEDVREMAKRENWDEKVKRINLMATSGKPGDWERAQNRALNFVQCHQLRRQIDRAVAHLAKTQNVEDVLEVEEAGGRTRLSARIFVDIAKAMAEIQHMTYAALGDTPAERKDKLPGEGEGEANIAGIHATLIHALNSAAKPFHSPAEELVQGAVGRIRVLKEASANDKAGAIEAKPVPD